MFHINAFFKFEVKLLLDYTTKYKGGQICVMRVLKNSYSTPFIPQSWGNREVGGHPQTLGRKVPAHLFQQSHYIEW